MGGGQDPDFRPRSVPTAELAADIDNVFATLTNGRIPLCLVYGLDDNSVVHRTDIDQPPYQITLVTKIYELRR